MMVAGDGEEQPEEPAPISDDDIYRETRKRVDNHEYKLPEDVLKAVKEKIVSIVFVFLHIVYVLACLRYLLDTCIYY